MVKSILKFFKSNGFILLMLIFLSSTCGAGIAEWVLHHTIFSFIIADGVIIIIYSIYLIFRRLDPYNRIKQRIFRQENVYESVKMFYKELLPLKQNALPKRIFKYVSLSDNELSNELRFQTLENNALWFSRSDLLNDPFEGYNLVLSKDFLHIDKDEYDKVLENFREYIIDLRTRIHICSFSQSPLIAPMWGHYASNGQGFCVEYEIVDNSHLYDVDYFARKYDLGFAAADLNNQLMWKIDLDMARDAMLGICFYLCSTKSRDWSYEKEVRCMLFDKLSDKIGDNITSDSVGLKLKSIYIGSHCSAKNENKLLTIAKKINAKVYIVRPDYNSDFAEMGIADFKEN